MAKLNFFFDPDGKDVSAQFGLDEKKIFDMASRAKDRFLNILSSEDDTYDVGVCINDALSECETIEEIIFTTYAFTKLMDMIDTDPLAQMMASLHKSVQQK